MSSCSFSIAMGDELDDKNATNVKKPASPPVRIRLEARVFKQNKLQDAEKLYEAREALEMRLEKAERKKNQQEFSKVQMAAARVERAMAIAANQLQKREFKNLKKQKSHQLKQELAQKKREELMERQRKKCKRRFEKISQQTTRILKIKTDKSQQQHALLEKSIQQAQLRREISLQERVDKLSEHSQLVVNTKERVQSAKLIQQWVRYRDQLRKASVYLRGHPNDLETIVALWKQLHTSFDEAMGLMQNKALNKLTQRFLGFLPRSKTLNVRPRRFRTFRVFLMAGLVAAHPEAILENFPEDAVSQEVYYASNLLVSVVNELATTMKELDSSSKTSKLAKCLKRFDAVRTLYIDMFARWKQVDGERLAGEMIRTYAEVYAANYETSLQHGSNGEEDKVHEIIMRTKQQLLQLRQAISNAIGHKACSERIAGVEKGIAEQLTVRHEDRQKREQSIKEAKEEKKNRQNLLNNASTSRPDLDFTKTVFSNDDLAHQLILNPKFEITPKEGFKEDLSAGASIEDKIRVTMKKAYWDMLVEAMLDCSNEKKLDGWVVLFEELRDLLASVVSKADINEVVSTMSSESIRQNLDEHVSTSESRQVYVRQLLRFFLSKILQNEAPVRNSTTQKWLDSLMKEGNAKEVIPVLLPFLYEKVDEIRLDSMNAQLRMLAPYLQRHGIEHEQKKFNEKLSNGVISLEKTFTWLKTELTDDQLRLLQNNKGHSLTYRNCLRQCFVSLLTKYVSLPEAWPETYSMDFGRLKDVRNKIDSLVLTASFIALIRQTLGRKKYSYPSERPGVFANELSVLLQDESIRSPDICIHVLQEVVRFHTSELSEEEKTELHGQVQSVMNQGKQNVIFALFSRRIEEWLMNSLIEETSVCSQFKEFEEQLNQIFNELLTLCRHNEAVYANHYNEILNSIC